MASNKLMMELIWEMKKSIRDMEKLAGATKKTTKEISKQGKTAKVAGKRVNKFGQHIRRAGGNLRAFTAALTGIGALAGIFFIIGKAVRAMTVNTMESIQATAKLEAVLKATGHAVGMTRMELDNMSFAMSQNTTFAQTAITEAQGIMATFTKLGSETFPRAISAAADMSTMFGQTLQQSSIQLGTALNDPINGIGRLMRIGVSFSEQQKNQIDLFMAMGDVASAQGVILAELEAEMGGAAEAMEETLIGQIQKWSNNLALAGEQIGIIITMLPSLITFVQGMNDKIGGFITMPIEQKIMMIMDKVRGFIRFWFKMAGVVQTFRNILGSVFAFVLTVASAIFMSLGNILNGLGIGIKLAFEKFSNFKLGIMNALVVISKNSHVFKDNWVNIFKLAANGMKINFFKGVRGVLVGLETMVKAILDATGIPAVAKLLGISDVGDVNFTSGIDKIIAEAELLQNQLSEPFKPVIDEIKDGFAPSEKQLQLEAELASLQMPTLENLTQQFEEFQKTLGVKDTALIEEQMNQTLKDLGVTEQHLMDQIMEQIKQNAEDKKLIEENNKNLDILNNSWLSGAAKVTRAMEAAGIKMDKLGNSLGQAFAEGASVREIIGNTIAQVMGNIAAKSTEKSMADWVQGQFAAGDAAGEMAQGLSGLMGGLAGGLVGGLVGKLFSKKPKPPKKPIPVKVVNWGDMTQHLLKASMRRAVSPMITTSANSIMSANLSREARI
jgi:hypothetical protein